jgi:hypothetical protein
VKLNTSLCSILVFNRTISLSSCSLILVDDSYFLLVLIICLQIASEGLKHRVFEVSLADLQGDEDQAFRKIRLRAEDVQGKNVLTNFWVIMTADSVFLCCLCCLVFSD